MRIDRRPSRSLAHAFGARLWLALATALVTALAPLVPTLMPGLSALLPEGLARLLVGVAHASPPSTSAAAPTPPAPRCDPERLSSMSAEAAARDDEARALSAGLAVACDASAFDDGVDGEGGGVCDASGRSMVAAGRVRGVDARARLEAGCASGVSNAAGRCVEPRTLRCADHPSAALDEAGPTHDAPALDLHELELPSHAVLTQLTLRVRRAAPGRLEGLPYRLIVTPGVTTLVERPPR
jgi:hypothetical protein